MVGPSDSNDRMGRKAKVLSFVEKDIFVINNYESAAFKNKNHAIECLIPYHVFQVMADDIKFKGSDVDIDLGNEIEVMLGKLERLMVSKAYNEEGFTAQLLLFFEQKYFNSIMPQNRTPVNKNNETMADNSSMIIRIPKSPVLYVYGPPHNLRMKKYGK